MVVVPEIVTVPGKVAIIPDLPIVMPVADDAPIVTVPVASIVLFESPLILVPVNVSDAKATETEIPIAAETTPINVARVISRLLKFGGESCIASSWGYFSES